MSEPRPARRGKAWPGIGLAICIVAFLLRAGLPLYRRQCAFDTMARLRVVCNREPWVPDWAYPYVGEGWHSPFDRIDGVTTTTVTLSPAQVRELLMQLRAIDGLVDLDVATAPVGDKDLEIISSFSRLEFLGLAATPLTDDGLKYVARLPNLRKLDLSRTQIDDAGLVHLAKLPKLEVLGIDHTRISNKGLEHLAGLTKLRMLSISNTAITDAGLEGLRKSHGELDVTDD